MTGDEAIAVLAEDHRRVMIHWYDNPEHRGTNCLECDALAALAGTSDQETIVPALNAEIAVAKLRDKPGNDRRFWAGYAEGLGFARELLSPSAVPPPQTGNCSNCGEPYATHTECGEFG